MPSAITPTRSISCPDPQPDRVAETVPARIAIFLHAVRILLGYGRHLAFTAKDRAAAPSFGSIAICFGTANLPSILAHLRRGILRAIALERVLLARAATGRDVEFVKPRNGGKAAPATPGDLPSGQPQAGRKTSRRRPRPAGSDDPELYMPTMAELLAQVRRRPLGRTIVDICLDLAVMPGVCTGDFWNELFDLIRGYGGSLATVMHERMHRQEAFAKEQDRRPTTQGWAWWDRKRETIRKALGFFVGEEPVHPRLPLAVPDGLAAAATGPP
jgi:hypothetical protein